MKKKKKKKKKKVLCVDTTALFGGETDGKVLNDLWLYNITQNRWSQPNVSSFSSPNMPPPRKRTNAIFMEGRLLMFSGEIINDFWEFIFPRNCLEYDSCSSCTNSPGCGWCSTNPRGYECVPGYNIMPYIPEDCLTPKNTTQNSFSTNIGLCPVGVCPIWVIAIVTFICSVGLFVGWHFLEVFEDRHEDGHV
eukprot:TRINITY_DN12702_c0_g5_i2.p1 TRINITY_DN12702_c0_g5~~TRINITY_DN12702_c0_g5_i2.p1  ORF type:complete len:192 (-),score=46.36 TRINITY_DN12702_c0_g5_i2:197-772(-)